MHYYFTLLLLLTSFCPKAWGKSFKLAKGGHTYSVSLPDSYEYYPTLLGLENVFLSVKDPQIGAASLSLTLTGIKDAKFDAQAMSQSQKNYQEGRLKYLQERNLSLVQFLPYSLKKNSQGHQIHSIGVIYTDGKKVTADLSYMLECPENFIHAKVVGDVGILADKKSFIEKKFFRKENEELEKAIINITCGNKK